MSGWERRRLRHLGLTGMHDTGGGPVRALSRIEALERHVYRGRGENDRRESCESCSPAPGTSDKGQRSRHGHPDEGAIGRNWRGVGEVREKRRRRGRHRSVNRAAWSTRERSWKNAVEPPSLEWAITAGLIHRDFDGWRVGDRSDRRPRAHLSMLDRRPPGGRTEQVVRPSPKGGGHCRCARRVGGGRRSPEALARQGPVAGPVMTEITHPVRAKIERHEVTGWVIRRTSFQRSSQPSQPSPGRDPLLASDPTDRRKGPRWMTDHKPKSSERVSAFVALASLAGAVVVLVIGSIINVGPIVMVLVGLHAGDHRRLGLAHEARGYPVRCGHVGARRIGTRGRGLRLG